MIARRLRADRPSSIRPPPSRHGTSQYMLVVSTIRSSSGLGWEVVAMPTRTRATVATPTLLACGVVAGPLYVVGARPLVPAREGFDLRRHPLSLLSLGDLGWIQIANFTVSGLLAIAFAGGPP